MAKTAILRKTDNTLVGIGQSAGTIKLVLDGASLKEEDVVLVTAKTFEPSEQYPTFKDMTMTKEERDEAAKKAAEADKVKADKEAAKAEKDKAKAEKAANKPAGTGTRNTAPLEGPYYVAKPFPSTPADHPKMPIWEAIANNVTVEAAKAACPAVNPPRKTSGVYTFNSEFRYLLNTGYVATGERPEATEGTDGGTAEGQEAEASA